MLLWIGGAVVVCLLCVVLGVVLMQRRRKNDPDLVAVASLVRGKTIDQAMTDLKSARPDIRTVMIAPDQEYNGPTAGITVVFHGVTGSEPVRGFDFGRQGSWVDHA